MKSKFARSLVLVAGLAGVLTVPSWAQPDAPTEKHVVQQTHPVTALKIEHVRAEMMAEWFTPSSISRVEKDEGNKDGGTKGVALADLPGLESVVAAPKENEIWVKGTPESITRLREIVSFLDRPVRAVDVKVQFVEVDKSEASNLGVAIADGAARKAFVLSSEFQDKLTVLVNSRRARVLHASQVMASNNSEVKVSSPANAIAPGLEWSAIPTIQNDNSITLFFTPQIDSKPKLALTTVASIKAGDIMVLNIGNSDDEQREMLAVVATHIGEEL